MASSLRLRFLGWDRSPLKAAAEWLRDEVGKDMSGWLVALPGARAGRRLRERLAVELEAGWTPPRILTAGALVDELLRVEGRPAGRLVRTLAWERALRALTPAERGRIVARAPGAEDVAGWTRLAEQVRGLFGELAAEGLDFRHLAEHPPRPQILGETARWDALARAQELMVDALAKAGLVDPHLARIAAIDAQRVKTDARVVLVGVVDMNRLLRRTLAQMPERVTALVPAPDEHAADFDELGCLRVKEWKERDVDLPRDRWLIADKPDGQAEETIRALSQWSGCFPAEQITIGVADAEVVPYLRQRLAHAGITARDAAGLPLPRTEPARLLEACARFLARGTFADYAALVRHPDLETALRTREGLEETEPAEILDKYQRKHLPAGVGGLWPGGKRDREPIETLHRGVQEVLGELAGSDRRPLPAWAPAIRELLITAYGGRDLDPDVEDDRVLGAALSEIASALAEIEDAPETLAPPTPASDALEMLLRILRPRAIPPRAPRPGEPTIELLGWLELALDDAPALVVTGFEEGHVPEAVHGDAFLPDRLRGELGLVDNERRLARDVFATHLLRECREEAIFVTGRRTAAGDPLLPSRIAFHRPPEKIVARVRHWLPEEEGERPTPPTAEAEPRREVNALPRLPEALLPERLTVTSFRDWFESPYGFYLRHVLEIKTLDDRAREMDPLGFGKLAHRILDDFGKSELRDSLDAGDIARYLRETLQRRSELRFGKTPLPAVALQIAQLAHRLSIFAERQAERVRDGWRIVHSEWQPANECVPLDVDGGAMPIKGRIDRIDRHEDGRYAIFDYKTGEKVKSPESEHGGVRASWKDLQLPLYTLLAREVTGDDLPELGYVGLGKEEANVGFLVARKWKPGYVDEALDQARDVVRAVRRGEFFDLGRRGPREEILQAIAGIGLISDEEGEEEEP